MTKLLSMTIKSTACFLLLMITLQFATSVRILDEVDPQPPVLAAPPADDDPVTPDVPDIAPVVGNPTSTLPSGQIPATETNSEPPPEEPEQPDDDLAPVATPTTTTPHEVPAPVAEVAPVVAPPVATATVAAEHPVLSFFMHDILGGSHPSARVVTGITTNAEIINGLPFTKPNNNVFPVNGGVPLVNNINNNGFIPGFNGRPTTFIQNNGQNNLVNGGNNLPFVSGGQLPPGASLQNLLFGSITVFDDELTEGHELGSAVIGAAQGFYLASSLDGTSQTMAFSVLMKGGEHHEVEDTISFFGVHRMPSMESHVAIVGGTGKYENAKGYAVVKALHGQEDQHITDGEDSILQFDVYLPHV